jgi:calcium-dependent protein kinase
MGGACGKLEKVKDIEDENFNPYSTQQLATKKEPKRNSDLLVSQDLLVQGKEFKNVYEDYKFISLLGEGAYGSVEKVVHIKTNIKRALKKISKQNQVTTEKEILNEIDILKKTDHPNIVKIYEFYNLPNFYCIITEFCEGGELFDYIIKFGPFQEAEASFIFYQILSALYFLHSSNIIHRDLKPENIIIESIRKEDKMCYIKLIDFGTAKLHDKDKSEKRKIGSSYYMAPEVLKKNYNEKCDLWSCGVILYILLTKVPPFGGKTEDKIFPKILKGTYKIEGTPLQACSSDVKDLISQLLELDPKKRLSAGQALKHPWFIKMKTKELLGKIVKANIKTSFQQLSSFKPNFGLQHAAIAFLVHNMPQSEELRQIASIFRQIDESGDGRITKAELIQGYKLFHPNLKNPEEEVEKIFSTIDTDNNGYLEFEEFARVLINKKQLMTKEILRFSFDFFDRDGSGAITLDELEVIFGKHNSDTLKKILDEIDTDKNQKITFEEFEKMMIKIVLD